jgi:hypothetical protein
MYDPQGFKTVAVARKGRFFCFPFEVNGKRLSVREIQHQLEQIVTTADAAEQTPHADVGFLTSENRTVWAQARDDMFGQNAQAFEKIESAAFLV